MDMTSAAQSRLGILGAESEKRVSNCTKRRQVFCLQHHPYGPTFTQITLLHEFSIVYNTFSLTSRTSRWSVAGLK